MGEIYARQTFQMNILFKMAMADTPSQPPTIAERLQALAEAVEKFARAVENGEIAPPRKKK